MANWEVKGRLTEQDLLTFGNRSEWRSWLETNHSRVKEAWLIHYKKFSGKLSVSYDEAVEEALCFGWIDGKKRSVDRERYAFRFTPRGPKSSWSTLNIRRAKPRRRSCVCSRFALAIHPTQSFWYPGDNARKLRQATACDLNFSSKFDGSTLGRGCAFCSLRLRNTSRPALVIFPSLISALVINHSAGNKKIKFM